MLILITIKDVFVNAKIIIKGGNLMKKLILLRGAMGVGKSTFIKEKGLKNYTVSADEIRLMLRAPVLSETGDYTISQKDNNKVWKLLFEIVEKRMSLGEFIVVDATHITNESITRYKKLANKYRYRVYVIDFTSIPVEVTLKRNRQREKYKQVSDELIEKTYEKLKTETIPGFVTIIPYEKADEAIKLAPLDFSSYKKVHHIGDIHGSYEPLVEYFKDGLKNDELYIFLGDYVDRGIQNTKVINFLISIMDKPNVILLEGNHERWFWKWANGESIPSKTFETETKLELEENNINKKEVRMLYRKLRNIAYYTYHDKEVLVTHGGLSTLPKNLNLISSEQIIKGVGDYSTDIDEAFANNVEDKNIIQIHGHRNSFKKSIRASNNSFNLEGKVEFGGNLRVLTMHKSDKEVVFTPIETKNTVFKLPEHIQMLKDTESLLEILRKDDNIIEKKFGNISSFNFSNNVFFDRKWNHRTVKARGLFINTQTKNIVARGYEKFFNIGEIEGLSLESLQDMKFPATAYVKENGYLGLVGINENTSGFVFTSKSSLNSKYALWLKKQFYDILNDRQRDDLKAYLIKENTTLAFEVIEPTNNPHIIKYPEKKLVLLDVIKRTPKFEKLPYKKLVKFAKVFGFEYKKVGGKFRNYNEFIHWYEGVMKKDFKFNNDYIEGFVIDDTDGFMVKLKLYYYNLWKYLRILKEKIERNEEINVEGIKTDIAIDFIKFLETLPQEDLELDIINLRDKFYDAKLNNIKEETIG
jgi:predicted kinase